MIIDPHCTCNRLDVESRCQAHGTPGRKKTTKPCACWLCKNVYLFNPKTGKVRAA